MEKTTESKTDFGTAFATGGVNLGQAKASLLALKKAFSVGQGGIPEAALSHWADAYAPQAKAVFMALGRSWEA